MICPKRKFRLKSDILMIIFLILFILSWASSQSAKLVPKILACGNKHSLMIDSENKVYAFGRNDFGQLGDGTTTDRFNPVSTSFAAKTIILISAGSQHSLAVPTERDAIFSWGNNEFGQLGIGDNSQSVLPMQVKLDLGTKKIAMISAGSTFSVAIDSSGNVLTWGNNDGGQLGDGSVVAFRTAPVAISSAVFGGKKIVSISAGFSHVLAVDEDGNVFAWGENFTGDLGDGSSTNRNIPVAVSFSTPKPKIVGVSAGQFISFAWDINGIGYSWGFGIFGGLGIGNLETKYTPNQITNNGILTAKKIASISGKYGHAVALTESNELVSWGYNMNGQLGDSTRKDSSVPVFVNKTGAILGKKIVSIAQGGVSHSLVFDSEGSIYGWGKNYNGELGDIPSDTFSESIEPYKIKYLCKSGYLGENCDYPICYGVSAITTTPNKPNVCSGRGNCASPDKCVCNTIFDSGSNCENNLFENFGKFASVLSPLLSSLAISPPLAILLTLIFLLFVCSCCLVCLSCVLVLAFCVCSVCMGFCVSICSLSCVGLGCCSQCSIFLQRISLKKAAAKQKLKADNSLLMTLTNSAVQNQDDE